MTLKGLIKSIEKQRAKFWTQITSSFVWQRTLKEEKSVEAHEVVLKNIKDREAENIRKYAEKKKQKEEKEDSDARALKQQRKIAFAECLFWWKEEMQNKLDHNLKILKQADAIQSSNKEQEALAKKNTIANLLVTRYPESFLNLEEALVYVDHLLKENPEEEEETDTENSEEKKQKEENSKENETGTENSEENETDIENSEEKKQKEEKKKKEEKDLQEDISLMKKDLSLVSFLGWENLLFFWIPEMQIVFYSILKIVFLLIAIAYFTIAERKVMGAVQRRKGPNVIGFWGLLQPLADGAKLMFKELLIPTRANNTIFLFAPIMVLVLSIVSWSIIPSGLANENHNPFGDPLFFEFSSIEWEKHLFLPHCTTVDINYGVLFLLAISGLNVYGIIIAGWASNSKYAFLGCLRSAAQMISYEVSLGLLILPVILLAGSLNFSEIVFAQEQTIWFAFPLLPCAIMFFISMLAETNRAPFDLPEAEAELVAGYNVEYSSIIFAMFFLGEYSNMLLMATVIILFFGGGWLVPAVFLNLLPTNLFFSLKIVFICTLFIFVRAAYPRYRYDQLMDLGWKILLPISLSFFVFIAGVLVAFDGTPQVLEIIPQTYRETFFFTSGANVFNINT